MRRSFGQGLGGSGGGGRGEGGMIRNVHRAVRTSMGGSHGLSAEPHAHATSTRTTSNNRNLPVNTTLSLSSTSLPCSYLNNSYMASPPNCPFTMSGDDFDWEYVDEYESTVHDDIMFGSVPSNEEISHAVTSLQEVLEPLSFEQLIKDRERMVISLSSDKAVWNAVMNNDVVREIREAVTEGKSISEGSEDSVNDTNPVTQLLRWMFVNTKDKVIEVVEKITKIVNELVQHMNKGKTDTNGVDSFQEKLKSSFFLSIMVLLIVVVSRSRKC